MVIGARHRDRIRYVTDLCLGLERTRIRRMQEVDPEQPDFGGSQLFAGRISLPADHRGITRIIKIARELAPGQSVTAHSPVIFS